MAAGRRRGQIAPDVDRKNRQSGARRRKIREPAAAIISP